MNKNILITGGSKRGGAAISRAIHRRGFNVLIHCRDSSEEAAKLLTGELNAIRPNSASYWSSDLSLKEQILPTETKNTVGIVANASEYIKSNLENFDERLHTDIQTHLTSHLRLIQLLKNNLINNNGSVVAVLDIRINRPKKGNLTYQISKGALDTAVRSLAIELAPEVRVNSVSPGPLEWPTNPPYTQERKDQILNATPLFRVGKFDELSSAVCFLLFDATFTTGATIPVDGGRSIYLV